MSKTLEAPFPWFGGKSRAAELIWDRFGDVDNYVEPFFGSGAVLLGRPTEARLETVNDLDCMVANFWRATQRDPEAVAAAAGWPANEADKAARHLWLSSRASFRERMKTDPDYYDAKIAGWWVWGQCLWIGGGWCARQLPEAATEGVVKQLINMGTQGVFRRDPPFGAGQGDVLPWFQELSARLRRVRVVCGDWSRVVSPACTTGLGLTGVLLDPPYTEGKMDYAAGGCGGEVADAVREWAISHGDDPLLRIALCGYEGEHKMPASWEEARWKPMGGRAITEEAREGRQRERIWFSPHCLNPMSLFSSINIPFDAVEISIK